MRWHPPSPSKMKTLPYQGRGYSPWHRSLPTGVFRMLENIINKYFSTWKGMSRSQGLMLHGAQSKIRVCWWLALKLVTKPYFWLRAIQWRSLHFTKQKGIRRLSVKYSSVHLTTKWSKRLTFCPQTCATPDKNKEQHGWDKNKNLTLRSQTPTRPIQLNNKNHASVCRRHIVYP